MLGYTDHAPHFLIFDLGGGPRLMTFHKETQIEKLLLYPLLRKTA